MHDLILAWTGSERPTQHVIRSGRLALLLLTCSCWTLVGALALVVFRIWLPAAALGGLVALGLALSTVLLRDADPEQLKARAAKNEKWRDA